MLRAVYKQKTEASISYTVAYNNTNEDKTASTPIGTTPTHTYTSTSQSAETTTTLGIDAPTTTTSGYTYSFAGWATTLGGTPLASTDGAKLSDILGAAPTDGGNYNLYAIWTKTPITYQVRYNAGTAGGANVTGSAVTDNKNVPDAGSDKPRSGYPTDATTAWVVPSGYAFKGWAKTSGGTTDVSGSDFTTINGSTPTSTTVINLYAIWEKQTFDVTFKVNNGAWSSTATDNADKKVAYSTTATTLATDSDGNAMPVPQRTGYSFSGWATTATGTPVVSSTGAITGTINKTAGSSNTLYAIWTEKTYTINWYERWQTNTSPVNGYTATSSINYTSGVSTKLMDVLADSTKTTWASTTKTLSDGTTTYTVPTVGDEVKADGKTYRFEGWYIVKSGNAWTSATGTTALADQTLSGALGTTGVTAGDTSVTIFAVWKNLDQSVTYSTNTTWGGATCPSTHTIPGSAIAVGDTYKVEYDLPITDGHYFKGWAVQVNGGGTVTLSDGTTTSLLQKGDKYVTNSNNIALYAQWEKCPVTVVLNNGADDSSIALNPQASLDFVWNDKLTESSLTTATPTRTNHVFKGWAKTPGGTVIVGPTDSDASFTITGTEADTKTGSTLNLYAVWEELKYTVKYGKNEGTDSTNSVSFTKKDGGATAPTVDSLYTWKDNSALKGDSNLVTGVDINVARLPWYSFEGWTTKAGNAFVWDGSDYVLDTANGYTLIDNTKTIGELLPAGDTSRVLTLYAAWKPVYYTVNYTAEGSHGNVNPLTEVVNLATGWRTDGSAIAGSTAAVNTDATGTGYELAKPTWTYNGAAPADTNYTGGITNTQAFYRPSLTYLRSLYTATPATASATFTAHFSEKSLYYQVQFFWQNADGTYNSTSDDATVAFGSTDLKAKFGTTVKHDDLISGTELYKLPLALINGVTGSANEYLYEFDTSMGDALSFTVADEGTGPFSNNVLKLYYKRLTYDLTALFKTVDASGTTTSGKPASATSVNSDATTYLVPPTGYTNLEKLRWGDTVTVTSPTATGYNFAWSVTTPASPDSAAPASTGTSSFVLSAKDMATLMQSAGSSKTATLTGTFSVVTYTVTLKDTDANANHSAWFGDAAALGTSPYQIAATVAADGSIGITQLTPTDTTSYQYYFAGWQQVTTSGGVETPVGSPISSDALKDIKTWSGNVTYKGVWKQKVIITYEPGTPDSNGNSKADWGTAPTGGWTVYIPGTDIPAGTEVYLENSTGKFDSVVGSAYIDPASRNPKAVAGYKFAYWAVSGTTDKYGHGSVVSGSPQYLTSTAAGSAVHISDTSNNYYSYTFVAVWEALPQTVTVNKTNATGAAVTNNTLNTNPVSMTYNASLDSKTYNTDDEVNLADYAALTIEGESDSAKAGYTLTSWAWKHTAPDGTVTTGTYTDASKKFNVKVGTTELTPLFKENTVTFTYELASGSTGKGSINPTTSDTVYAVWHNGVNDHTATTTNATAYKFVNWTYSGTAVDTDGTLDATDMGITVGSGAVLTGNRTYVANFTTRQYLVYIINEGTDDLATKVALTGSSAAISGTSSSVGVDGRTITADWGATLGSALSPATIVVTPPKGYLLDGWIVNGGTTKETWSGTASIKGVDAFTVDGVTISYLGKDVTTLQPYFVLDTAKKYTVNYAYDPAQMTGTTFTPVDNETSKVVAWADGVQPAKTGNRPPTASGYTFDDWYLSYDASTGTYGAKLSSISSSYTFSDIYAAMLAAGLTAPNFDEAGNSITIYGRWTADPKTVAIDVRGTVDSIVDASTGNVSTDGVSTWTTPSSYGAVTSTRSLDARSVTWNDLAGGAAFNVSGSSWLTRPGYTLKDWYATVTDGSGTTTTKNPVDLSTSLSAPGDTFGSLAKLNSVGSITLHAIWESNEYTVVYHYEDPAPGAAAGSPNQTPDTTTTAKWAELVKFCLEPTYTDHIFKGWTVEYVGIGEGGTGSKTHTRILYLTDPDAKTSISDMRQGDAAYVDTETYAVHLYAVWSTEGYYQFHDVLVPVAGTPLGNGGDVPAAPVGVEAGTTVDISDYGTITPNKHNGYDYDATRTATSFGSDGKVTVVGEMTTTINVYYAERTYRINFSDDAGNDSWRHTEGNAYTTAVPTLPVDEPTKAGKSFAGWLLVEKDASGNIVNSKALDGTNTIASLFTVAPALGTQLYAVPTWSDVKVHVDWATGAHGSVSPAAPTGGKELSSDAAAGSVADITGTPAADYEFQKITVTSPDFTGTATIALAGGATSATSEYGTIVKNADGSVTLTPTPWSDGYWHDVTYTFEYALTSALEATIRYYLEDGNNLGTYIEQTSAAETDKSATDGMAYTVTGTLLKSFDGYTINSGASDLSHTYVYSDAATHTYSVYYTANAHKLSYRYVTDSTATTDQAEPSGAPGVATINPSAGYLTVYTGQTVTLAATPTPVPAGYDFRGWYKGTSGWGTAVGSITVAGTDGDIQILGTWSETTHTVQFISDSTAGVSVTQNVGGIGMVDGKSGYQVVEGAQVATAVNPAATTLAELGVTYNPGTQAKTVTGWKVLYNGVTQKDPLDSSKDWVLGLTQPLSHVVPNVNSVTFVAVWSDTYAVTYDPSTHGAFTKLEYNGIQEKPDHTYPAIDVSIAGDADGKYGWGTSTPAAKDGWEFAGWGRENASGTWEFYFADDGTNHVDYDGKTRSSSSADAYPGTVDQNLHFVAFFKAKARTLVLSAYDPDTGAAYTPNPASFASDATTTFTVYTGETQALPTASTTTSGGNTFITRDGYTLTGWKDATGKPYSTSFKMDDLPDSAATVTLYPVFSFDNITISYTHGTGGDVDRTSDTKDSTTDNILGSVPKADDGYVFAGWTKDGGTTYLGASDGYDATTHKLTPSVSGTYTAHFTKRSDYVVTFEGGEPSSATTTATGLPYGSETTPNTKGGLEWDSTVTTLEGGSAPVLTGHDFQGWKVYSDAAHTNQVATVAAGTASEVLKNLAGNVDADGLHLYLVAQWTKTPYTLTYELETGDSWRTENLPSAVAGTPNAPENYEYGDQPTLRGKYSAKHTGKELLGWTDGTNNYTFAGGEVLTITGNTTLKPIWGNMTYKVTFETGVASGDDNPVTSSSMPSNWSGNYDGNTGYNTPSRPGYDFQGWTVTVDGGGTPAMANVYIDGTTYTYDMIAGSDEIGALTLTASWKAQSNGLTYVIGTVTGMAPTWTASGSVNPETDAHDVASTFDLRDASTAKLTGWTLKGWHDDELNVDYLFDATTGKVSFTMPAGNKNLLAIWERTNDYSVTFEGNAPSGAYVEAGTVVTNLPYATTATEDPTTKGGFQWDTDATGLVDTHAPSFAGWEFLGWTVYEYGTGTQGAVISYNDDSGNPVSSLTSPLQGTAYHFNVLAGGVDSDARHALLLVARWRVLTYDVTFADGVDAGDTPVATGTLPSDVTVHYTDEVDHTAPTRTGYTFDGWKIIDITNSAAEAELSHTAGDGKSAYSVLSGDNAARRKLRLVAQWTEMDGFEVTFVGAEDGRTTAADIAAVLTGNGLTVGATATTGTKTNLKWDDAVVVWPAPSRTGYTFGQELVIKGATKNVGWIVRDTTDAANVKDIGYITVDEIGRFTYSALAIDATTALADPSIKHLTLTALWTALTHTVTYDKNGGEWSETASDYPTGDDARADASKAADPTTYAVDDTVNLRSGDTATKAGQTLSGWTYTDTDGTTKPLALGATFELPNADVTLTAVWTPKTYSVNFDYVPAGIASSLVSWTGSNLSGLEWGDTVAMPAPSVDGYEFLGWVVRYAAETGARTGYLFDTDADAPYAYSALALTDTAAHASLTLEAAWRPARYRLVYVDDTSAAGVAGAGVDGAGAETQVAAYDDKLWTGTDEGDTAAVAGSDPWTLSASYADKTAAGWAFVGWSYVDASGTRVLLAAGTDGTLGEYGAIATAAGLALADDVTTGAELKLYATWLRRVNFVVDYVRVVDNGDGTTTETIESSETVSGLDGQDVATEWASTVLGMGTGHTILGYAFNAATSAATTAITTGVLSADAAELHIPLYYDQRTTYVVTYDGTLGRTWVGNYQVTTAAAPAWDTNVASFVPVDADWHLTGYTIDYWYFEGADGTIYRVDDAVREGTITFGSIAERIWGTVNGDEGRSDVADARAVTLKAAWKLREDYTVKYDDGYDRSDAVVSDAGTTGAIPEKFRGTDVIGTTPATPADRDNMNGSSTSNAPVSTDKNYGIEAPGANTTGGTKLDLYEIVGWDFDANYDAAGNALATPVRTASEGKTLAEIARLIWGADEPRTGSPEIELIARWAEVKVELTYTSVVATVDADGNVVSIAAGNAGGSVSRTSETVSAVTGTAQGSTATANPGYHFVGWQRTVDGTTVTIYAPDWEPQSLSAAALNYLFAMAEATGTNTIDLSTLDDATLAVAQNSSDGYWHEETYYALFAQNANATLVYDKNSSEATGSIANVTAPYGTLLTLSDGTGFTRTNWHIVSWNTEADGSGTSYEPGETGWPLPEAAETDGITTLYAIWAKDSASLTYDANGGTGTPAGYDGVWGDEVTVGTTTPTREGYTFTGWLGSDGKTYTAGDSFELVPGGVTLTAQWEKNTYTVTTGTPEGGHGTVTGGPVTIEWGEHIPEGTLVATPEPGYRVREWTYTLVGDDGTVTTGTVSDPSELAITGRVTFTPVFVADEAEAAEVAEAETEAVTATATEAVAETVAATVAVAGAIPQTGDTFAAVWPLVAAAFALLLLALVIRRRDDEDEA